MVRRGDQDGRLSVLSGHLEDDGLDWTVHLDDESGKYFCTIR